MHKYCKFNVSWLLKEKAKLSQRPRKKNQNWSNHLEKRAKYPSCRPTPSKCKDKGKGKSWGKTK